MFCKECVLKYLLTKKKEYEEQLQAYEEQMQELRTLLQEHFEVPLIYYDV